MNRFLRIAAGLALGLAAVPGSAATWWRLPIWGADIRVFASDPFQPGAVFCGTSRGNFYGSTDGGSSWAPLRQGPAFPGYVVTGLIADPRVPGRLWASLAGQYAGGLVVRSDNRGADWSILGLWKQAVATRALAIAPGDPVLIAVGGDDGVRLSRDLGQTWTRSGTETPGLAQVESLAFDPSDPLTLYAGTWRQGFRTRDGGATWARIAEGMVLDATIYSWDFAAPDPRDIWVSTCGWVYRTRDGGDRWTRFKNGFSNRRSHAVRRDPTRPGVVYAATVGGLHRSTDGGETWTRVSRESLVVTALEVDRATGRLYVGTEGEGVFTSDDSGATLANGSAGLTEGRVSDLVPDPNDPARVFFFRAYGGEESGVWEARGLKVRRVSRDLLPPSASLIAFRDGAGKTMLALSSSSGLRFSRDLGEHWPSPSNPPPGVPLGIYGAPFPAPILVTTAGVFRIGGAGEEFVPMGGPASPTASDLLSDASGSALLEVRSREGASRWNGQSWSSHRAGVLKGGIFLDQTSAAGSYSSLQEVGGKLIWEEGGRRLAVSSPRMGLALATAATAPGGRLYVGTTGDGLFLFEP
jgi:photosystem II stability/assembly factor-like uncharacterized protein